MTEKEKKSDYLQSLILSRLSFHICQGIYDKEKREHWCLQWTGNNITQMAVIMLLMNHVKGDLFYLHEDTNFLRIHDSFVNTNDER